MLSIQLRLLAVASLLSCCLTAAPNDAQVEVILSAYTKALGGQTAVDSIKTRQLEVKLGRGEKFTYYWQAPDHVIQIQRKQKQAAEGNSGWIETKKKKVIKLGRSEANEMQTTANPVRFVHLRSMYHELHVAPDVNVDGETMAVIVAPNSSGSTKFFFDNHDHLLRRIEEFGDNSVYFKHITDFSEYKAFDGLQLPTHLHRTTDEPGGGAGDWKLNKIQQNVSIDPNLFQKPTIGAPISGGKH